MLSERAQKVRQAKLFKSLLAGTVAVIAMWISAGPALAFTWHLFHQSSFVYRELTIPVPRHSYVTYTASGPSILTLSAGAPFFNRPYGSIFVTKTVRPFYREKNYPGFVEAMKQVASHSGHQFVASRTVTLGDRSAFCLEFVRQPKQPLVLVDCAIDGSDIFVSYEGDSRYVSDVFDTLYRMFPSKPPVGS